MGLAMGSLPNLGMGLANKHLPNLGMTPAVWGAFHVGTIFAVKKCAIGGRFLLTASTKIWYNGGWFSKPGGACAPKFFPNFYNKSQIVFIRIKSR